MPKLTASQLAELQDTGTVSLRDVGLHLPDDARFRDPSLTDLALTVALNRLRASAASHRPRECADCTEELPAHHFHSGLCDECAARQHELQAA